MVVRNLAAKSAPHNSSLGIVYVLVGAKRLLAVINRDSYISFPICHIMYAAAPKACIEPSENITKDGFSYI